MAFTKRSTSASSVMNVSKEDLGKGEVNVNKEAMPVQPGSAHAVIAKEKNGDTLVE